MTCATLSGEAIELSRRARLTDDQVRRGRDRQMFAMRSSGATTAEIAVFFSFTPQYINQCLRAIPADEKRRLREAARHAPLA